MFTWELEPPQPFSFLPGQFNMIYGHGVGEVPISMSGSPDASSIVHTIRAVGRVTRALATLKQGEFVGVRGPYGNGWPVLEARGRDVFFIAGGLGLAPLRSAILYVLEHRGDYDRVVIAYGTRTPEDILFREELGRWGGRFDVRLEAIVDRAARDWHGPVGVVTRLVDEAVLDFESCTAMVCGPEIMMRFVARALQSRGASGERIWLSMERSMKCGVGLCGHCQLGGKLLCRDGPVHRYDRLAPLLRVREL